MKEYEREKRLQARAAKKKAKADAEIIEQN